MNTLLSLIFTVCTIFGSWQSVVPYAKVDQAFDAQNAESIVAFSREKMVIKLSGKEGIYSKSQAVQIIKEFFVKHPKGAFDFTFKGAESDAGTFAIGNYVDGKSKYRVTIHFKNGADGYKIECLTIE